MADKDSDDKPSLELPSFGFGRKKKGKPAEPTAPLAPELEPDVAEHDPATPEPGPAHATARPRVERADPYVRPVAAPSSPVEPRPSPEPRGQATSAEHDEPSAEHAPRREISFPAVPALQAVLVVGALIGLLAVLLTFASLKFCEVARGTDSCGGSGWLLLLATVVLLTYVGGWLLRGFGITDPGSTSFLAVGLLVVMVIVFFLDVIYNWWMILAIPPVSMAMYALSWWVTTRLVETDDGRN